MAFNPSPQRSILLIAPFFLWGTAMVAMKGTVPHLTPLFLATVRLLPAGFLVLGAGMLKGRPQPQGWTAWLWIGAFAVVDGTLFQGFLAEGLFRTGAGLGSVMIDSQPMAVALLAGWLFGEQLGLWGALGLAIGIGGISLLGLPDEWILGSIQAAIAPMIAILENTPLAALPIVAQDLGYGGVNLGVNSGVSGAMAIALGNPSTGFSSLFSNGQWLMLMAALSMAVGTILSRYVSRHSDPVMATGWHMVLGGIPLALGSLAWETPDLGLLTLLDYGALTYSTVFGTAIAYALFFYFAAQGSLTSLSALTFLTPIFALLFGHLLLHEVLSPLQSVGVFLTLISIYLINQRETLAQLWPPRSTPTTEATPEGAPLPKSGNLPK